MHGAVVLAALRWGGACWRRRTGAGRELTVVVRVSRHNLAAWTLLGVLGAHRNLAQRGLVQAKVITRALTTTTDAGVPLPVGAAEHALREAEGVLLGAARGLVTAALATTTMACRCCMTACAKVGTLGRRFNLAKSKKLSTLGS